MQDNLLLWDTVTKSWTGLESIFLASADIRAQLPDDTKRFEGIDNEFKEMMKEACQIPLAVESCTVEGLSTQTYTQPPETRRLLCYRA